MPMFCPGKQMPILASPVGWRYRVRPLSSFAVGPSRAPATAAWRVRCLCGKGKIMASTGHLWGWAVRRGHGFRCRLASPSGVPGLAGSALQFVPVAADAAGVAAGPVRRVALGFPPARMAPTALDLINSKPWPVQHTRRGGGSQAAVKKAPLGAYFERKYKQIQVKNMASAQ